MRKQARTNYQAFTQLHLSSKPNMLQGKVRVSAYCGPETGLNARLGAKKLMDALVVRRNSIN